jgi:hypothetical protein
MIKGLDNIVEDTKDNFIRAVMFIKMSNADESEKQWKIKRAHRLLPNRIKYCEEIAEKIYRK